MRMSGAKALVECLKHEGVDLAFGIPGGASIPLYDVLCQESDGLRHVLTRHEQGAAFMADGYARSTGKVGVCMATSGPGATNLVTGIADAYMDSIPVVAVTGQVSTTVLGTDAFQEVDTKGITMPIVKHSYLLRHAEEVPQAVAGAFHIARTGRPGPVLIDLPRDVQQGMLTFKPVEKMEMRGYQPLPPLDENRLDEAVSLLRKAKRPVIYVGGGCIASSATEEIVALAERIHAPVINSLLGKGVIPEDHPLSLGMPGMHGVPPANLALNEADLILAFGTRFDDRVVGKVSEFAKAAKIIHVDADPAELGKTLRVVLPIVGDASTVAATLLGTVEEQRHNDWVEQVMEWRRTHPLDREGRGKLPPQAILNAINELTKGEAIIATDVGQHQMWAAQHIICRYPRHYLTSGGLGAMGFGFPAGIGAQLANPDHRVVCIAGDGSFQMNIQELATAAHHKLPMVIAVFNNRYLGMVKQWQKLFFERRYSAVDLGDNPDFVRVAEAYGAHGIGVEDRSGIRPALEQALNNTDAPTLIDFKVEREADVYPMIPSGQSVKEMILDAK